MRADIQWNFPKSKINNVHLDLLERKLDVRLPIEYRELMKFKNGARPSKKVIQMEIEEKIIKSFLPVHSTKGSVYEAANWLKDYLPPHSIPFANDPFGNFFLFCSNSSTERPYIYFWNHELLEKQYITSSFRNFLDLLK